VTVSIWAPGRVNLIGDHTDYADGLVLPMAIDLGVRIDGVRCGETVELASDNGETASISIHIEDPSTAAPGMAQYVAGVIAEVRPDVGFTGTMTSTLPVGSGLSSSSALEVGLALALGFSGTAVELAQLTQRAEQIATGVPCGIMDQLTIAAGIEGRALLIDCATLDIEPTALPEGATILVVHSGEQRKLVGSAYAERRNQVESAMAAIGPLRDRPASDAEQLDDPATVKRARHVISENARVRQFAEALARADLDDAGRLMVESHHSLRDDFEVSTPGLDALVADLLAQQGVYGARLTGAGFGGCVVALTDPGVDLGGWQVHPSAGAAAISN